MLPWVFTATLLLLLSSAFLWQLSHSLTYFAQQKGMTILVDYHRKWRRQLSIGKTVSPAYHLNNREARRDLDMFVNNKRLVVQQAPKYLCVRLDRMLNFKQHLEEVAGKVTYRVSLIRRLAGTPWEASAKTLRISTHALVGERTLYSTSS